MCQTQNLNYITPINFAACTNYSTCTVFFRAKTEICIVYLQFHHNKGFRNFYILYKPKKCLDDMLAPFLTYFHIG